MHSDLAQVGAAWGERSSPRLGVAGDVATQGPEDKAGSVLAWALDPAGPAPPSCRSPDGAARVLTVEKSIFLVPVAVASSADIQGDWLGGCSRGLWLSRVSTGQPALGGCLCSHSVQLDTAGPTLLEFHRWGSQGAATSLS